MNLLKNVCLSGLLFLSFAAFLNAQINSLDAPQQATEDSNFQNDYQETTLQKMYQHLFSDGVHLSKDDLTEAGAGFKNANCTGQAVDRTVDGTCNNVQVDTSGLWGAASIPLERTVPAAYNGNNDIVGENRLNPRSISNLVCQTSSSPKSTNLSAMVFTWGQFLDHDLSISPVSTLPGECAPIPPTGEAGDIIVDSIEFNRSAAFTGTGAIGTTREQENLITSWIDASNVYGSDIDRANWLRTFSQGKLKTSSGNMLPYNTDDLESSSAIDSYAPLVDGEDMGMPLYVAGDIRANEQPGLTCLHTLFVREHNRICNELLAGGITNDELIYQAARKKVSGLIQAITFNEFLPSLGVELDAYSTYNPNVKGDIVNVFSSAAYRLGHTMVTSNLSLMDDRGQAVGPGSLQLKQAFFNPSWVESLGIEPFLNGLAMEYQEEVDVKVVEDLRSFLFTPTPTGPGIDLAALNIQRGRDHGLADYNTYRQQYTGSAASSFADITSDPTLQAALSAAYADINDMDVWVGLLAEDHLANASVGPTLHNILKEQFENLRDGDFYFYKNDPNLSASDQAEIESTRLADVIRRNTSIDHIQPKVFYNLDRLEIPLHAGWNIISSYCMPDEPDMETVFVEIESEVIQVKDLGGAYTPSFSINDIGNWNIQHGYQVKMTETDTLYIYGTYMDPSLMPVSLDAGWNIVTYLLDYDENPANIFDDIMPSVLLVKNLEGVYVPSFNFNTLGEMRPGQGYQVKMSGGEVLIFGN